jgi:hypothetical protein
MHWTQNYDPFDSPLLATLFAALPILLLLGLLATGRVSAPWAALAGLVAAFLTAVFIFTPQEARLPDSGGLGAWAGTVLTAAGQGAAFGLFPIGWIVLAAIFLYSLTVETGHFEIVKQSVTSLSDDRRIQALVIAFCFGAFIEGAAGFGTPVAISAALLLGAGFRPVHAAGLALLANTSPVAFGALGTPIVTLADVTMPRAEDLPPLPADMTPEVWWQLQLSKMAGRQLPFFSLLVPAWLVWTMAGRRGVMGVWPALLVCGGSFALAQFLVANFLGPALVDVVGGLFSLTMLALFLRAWQPAVTWHFDEESSVSAVPPRACYSRRQLLYAWIPWALLSLLVFLCGESHLRVWLDGGPKGAGSQCLGRHYLLGLSRTGTPRKGEPSPPGGRPERGRESGLQIQLAVRDRHGHLRGGSSLSRVSADCTGTVCAPLHPDLLPHALAALYHRLHAGTGLHYALQRHGCHLGFGFHPDRLVLSVLRAAAGLAGGGFDRLGYFVQRPVRQPSTDHGAGAGSRSHLAWLLIESASRALARHGEQHRRRHG